MGIKYFYIMFHNNFIGQIRQIKRNIILCIIPIFIFLFTYLFMSFNLVQQTIIEPINLGLIINEDNIYTNILADSFTNSNSFSSLVSVTKDDKDIINKDFNNNKYDATIEIPDGFVDSIMYFDYLPIQVKINYKDTMKAVLLKNVFLGYEKYITAVEIGVNTLYDSMKDLGYDRELLDLYNQKIAYELVMASVGRNELFSLKEIVDVPTVMSTIYYFLAIVVMFLMYISVFSTINLIREREGMCLQRLKITKISLFNYILSKAISNTIFIVLIAFIWYTLFVIFSGNSFTGNIIMIGIFLIVIILFNISLTMMLSGLIGKEDGVILFSNVFIFINAIIGGSIIPIPMMPDSLQNIAIISPNYWMIRGLLYFESSYNFWEGIIILIIFLILSLIMIVITSSKYKTIN